MKQFNPIWALKAVFLLFILLGIGLACFAFCTINIPFGAWIIIGAFILVPSFLLYSLSYRIPISAKTQKRIDERRSILQFEELRFLIIDPLFDQTTIVEWDNIAQINYHNTNITDYEAVFCIELEKLPEVIMHQNRWWLNRWANKKGIVSKKVTIKEDTKNTNRFLDQISRHLLVTIDDEIFVDKRKGHLLSTIKVEDVNPRTITEHWKPVNNTETTVLFYKRKSSKY
ncbi:hypothetical protein [Flavobacterium sp. FlaQc-30]|uniref:hypothetical protein n=1 Tax=Flavobacterium sp. FlaQc-30 TaxID=3374179 RepID=UPI0037573CB7